MQGSVLIQRYGVNAEESRRDPGRDDALRLEDVEHGGVHYPERNGISRLDEMMMSGVVKVDMIIERFVYCIRITVYVLQVVGVASPSSRI